MTTNYQVVKNAEDLRQAVQKISSQPAVGLDTETTDLDPYTSRLRLIQLATPDCVYIVDLDAFSTENLAQAEALAPLRQLLQAQRPITVSYTHLTLPTSDLV